MPPQESARERLGDNSRSSAQRLFAQAAAGTTATACQRPGASSSSSSPADPPPSASGCPVAGQQEQAGGTNPLNNMPLSLAADPALKLGSSRQASSIPMAQPAPGSGVKHQEGNASDVWMYPSESMFYSAMQRKGWDPSPQDMPAVVEIHNSVNERAWREVMAWERLHAAECSQCKLKRFSGKPDQYSPKARLMNLLGFKLPFDRHDWIVDRCGTEVRYIIDFYSGAPGPGGGTSMFLDARPALDSFSALWDRLRMQFSWVSSGRWRSE